MAYLLVSNCIICLFILLNVYTFITSYWLFILYTSINFRTCIPFEITVGTGSFSKSNSLFSMNINHRHVLANNFIKFEILYCQNTINCPKPNIEPGALVQCQRARLQIEGSPIRILHWPTWISLCKKKWISETPLG